METFSVDFWVGGRFLKTVSALHGDAALQEAIAWIEAQPTGDLGNEEIHVLFCRQRKPDDSFRSLRVYIGADDMPHVPVPRKLPAEPGTFDMLFVVDGTWSVQVDAESEDDAQKKAEQMLRQADFGFLRSEGVEFGYELGENDAT